MADPAAELRQSRDTFQILNDGRAANSLDYNKFTNELAYKYSPPTPLGTGVLRAVSTTPRTPPATGLVDRRGEFNPTGKVRLVEELSNAVGYRPTSTSFRNSVVFEVQPELSEAKSTNYVEISEIRSYASLLIFMGSPSRNFSLNAKFVSRTEKEATENFKHLHLLKGWTMPDTNYDNGFDTGVPRTLSLYAYGKNIKGIPTVIKTLNIDYPVDCDYIITEDQESRMPIILNVSIQLQETRTPDELKAFIPRLQDYKTGQLEWW